MPNAGVQSLYGAQVVGSDGDKLGTVDEVYFDEATDQPSWATVKSGLFGRKVAFVPIAALQWSGDELQIPYDKDKVNQAPRFDPNGNLDIDEEQQLFDYYGIPYGGPTVSAEPARSSWATTGAAAPPSTDEAMTRSEEQMRVGVERREAGRARLRKYVVTEHVNQSVPVSREEVHLEREPITDANRQAAMSGPDISEAEHEVTLYEERPVVTTEAVPVERVRLSTDTVQDEETVSADVRKERIEADGVGKATRR
jgi:uncharacterized protein (TIGR02271 family)